MVIQKSNNDLNIKYYFQLIQYLNPPMHFFSSLSTPRNDTKRNLNEMKQNKFELN